MSELESCDDSASFDNIIRSLEQDGFPPTVEDLPIAPMDGQRVALDELEGENLRAALLGAYAFAKNVLSNSEVVFRDKRIEADFLARGIYSKIIGFQQGAFMGKLFALEGSDYFHVTGSDDTHISANFLNPSERLFGSIAGTAFSEYVTVNPDGDGGEGLHGPDGEMAHLVGGMLWISKAVICETDERGIGQIDRAYDEVFVPIHANGFKWLSAYPR